ncbi:MAG: type VI secretion system-associated protein TagF [Pseudomonadota bacterium]
MTARPVSGFYGKIPAAGDFIGRGLPRELTGRWDRWMEMALRDALATGGGGGIWRFRAGPGVFASDPVAGVWQLSRDRVGRRFPILIAVVGCLPAVGDPWFDAAEAALVAARAGGPLEGLTMAVSALPAPGAVAAATGVSFWRADAPDPVSFPTAMALASGGLTRLFEAGGPPLAEAGDGAEIDPMALWQDAANTRGGAPVPDDAEALDLDDLLADAGLGDETLSGKTAPTDLSDIPSSSDAEEALDLDDLLTEAGLDAPRPDDPSEAPPNLAPEPPVAQVESAPQPPPGDDLLDEFLDAEAAPLSGELPLASAEEILHGTPVVPASTLPDDFLDPAGAPSPVDTETAGLGDGDPLDALWGDDLPPPADPDAPPLTSSADPMPAAPLPLDGPDELLDLDDLIDGLGTDAKPPKDR